MYPCLIEILALFPSMASSMTARKNIVMNIHLKREEEVDTVRSQLKERFPLSVNNETSPILKYCLWPSENQHKVLYFITKQRRYQKLWLLSPTAEETRRKLQEQLKLQLVDRFQTVGG